MNINDVTILIPTRANLSYLEAAVQSIRSQEHYSDCKILIGADNPTKEIIEWLDSNSKGSFDFVIFHPEKGQDRIGIVNIYEKLMSMVKTKYSFILHDDMIIGASTVENLLNKWKPNTVLNSVRIEPPIYAATPEKIIFDLGTTPENFQWENFYELEKKILLTEKNRVEKGFFAPHFLATEDWIGYDHLYEPQSREDSNLAQRYMEKNFDLVTVWDSVVYHFSGKGSRKKDSDKDSVEWQKSNYKNTKNYIRQYKTIAHTTHILPIRVPEIPISAHVLVGNEAERLGSFLENVEPYFDELVFVIDTDQSKEIQEACVKEINKYSEKQLSLQPTNFNPNKFILLYNSLNNDFAEQTNLAVKQCQYDWTMKLDVDEQFPLDLLNNLRLIIKNSLDRNPNITVIGLPRINLLDGKVSNDIPREHWFTSDFNKYPNTKEVRNLDVQWRIHKKNVSWVNKVHEVPEPIQKNDSDRMIFINNFNIIHPKNRQRQFEQEQKYSSIAPKEKRQINKFVYDSVLFTVEGITSHARNEILELKKRGKEIYITDVNYNSSYGEEFKDMYVPFDWRKDQYITIVNQPPVRWNNTAHLRNRIGYLAFEGKLNKEWVKIINESSMIELWTPSEYCKKMFIKSGVQKPVVVIPHGVDNTVFKPVESVKQFDIFTFLAIGTAHNNRKGFDVLAKAFSEEFSKDEPVRLLYKINTIYNPGQSFNDHIHRYINWNGNTNIEYTDTNLTEKELVELMNKSHIYVNSSRCEGFGINILNAIAVGMPIVSTQGSGMDDFLDDGEVLKVNMLKDRWTRWGMPYEQAKWAEPDVKNMREQLRKAYTEYTTLKKKALKKVRNTDKHSWSVVVDKIENRIDELANGKSNPRKND